ncbi:MAG TPA: hypothetical protein VGI32_03800, partial [Steroidobacteraceae bacterium]
LGPIKAHADGTVRAVGDSHPLLRFCPRTPSHESIHEHRHHAAMKGDPRETADGLTKFRMDLFKVHRSILRFFNNVV